MRIPALSYLDIDPTIIAPTKRKVRGCVSRRGRGEKGAKGMWIIKADRGAEIVERGQLQGRRITVD